MKWKSCNLITINFALFAATALPVEAVAQQTVSGINGRIAFIRQIDADGAGEVLTANPDGSDERQVLLCEALQCDGVEVFSGTIWSPDGRELLIGHTLRIDPSTGQCCLPFRPAIVKPDGSDYRVLTMPYAPFDGGCNVWSLDQSRLLCGFGGDQPGIFSVRSSDGGDPVRLTTNPYSSGDVATDISPDGTRFLFLRYKPGASPGPRPFITEQVALFVENMDGTGLRQITPFGFAEPHELASASWSPDGNSIISSTKVGILFVIHPDGTGITPIHLQASAANYFAFEPNWSPDGARIVLAMCVSGEEDIYTAKPDGSDLKNVTNAHASCSGVGFENGPDWGRYKMLDPSVSSEPSGVPLPEEGTTKIRNSLPNLDSLDTDRIRFSTTSSCALYGRPCSPNGGYPRCCGTLQCVFSGGSTRVGYACK